MSFKLSFREEGRKEINIILQGERILLIKEQRSTLSHDYLFLFKYIISVIF